MNIFDAFNEGKITLDQVMNYIGIISIQQVQNKHMPTPVIDYDLSGGMIYVPERSVTTNSRGYITVGDYAMPYKSVYYPDTHRCTHCGNKWHEDSNGNCKSCGAPE